MSVPVPFTTHRDPAPLGLHPPSMHPTAPAAPHSVLTQGQLQRPGAGDMLGDSRPLLSPCCPLTQPLLRARDLQEAAVLSNIRTRFERQLIYVSFGAHSVPQRPQTRGLWGGVITL